MNNLVKKLVETPENQPGSAPPGGRPAGRRLSRPQRPPGEFPQTPPGEFPEVPPRGGHQTHGADEEMPAPGGELDDPVGRMTGRNEQFKPRELSELKDVVILILASQLHSDLDLQLANAFITDQPVERGLLQHILDEARNTTIPQARHAIMQKLFTVLEQSR